METSVPESAVSAYGKPLTLCKPERSQIHVKLIRSTEAPERLSAANQGSTLCPDVKYRSLDFMDVGHNLFGGKGFHWRCCPLHWSNSRRPRRLEFTHYSSTSLGQFQKSALP